MRANVDISNVDISFEIGAHIRLVDAEYKPAPGNAEYIEWMVKEKEISQKFLPPTVSELKERLREKIKQKLDWICAKAASIKKRKEEKININEILEEDELTKGIKITVKWAEGRIRKSENPYPAVNLVIPIEKCNRQERKCHLTLSLKEVEEIVYKLLLWISVSDMSESKNLEVVRNILCK